MLVVKRIVKKVLLTLGFSSNKKKYSYKIGNLKHHNARVDALTPKFIDIGDDFMSAPGAVVLSHDASPFINTGCYRVEKTIIGDRVFLGANSVILPGVTIGNDVIVGAGAVVTKNIDDGMVVAGNPAVVLCSSNDYFKKCSEKGCLYKAPSAFDSIREDGRPTSQDVDAFQNYILREMDMNNE